MSADDRLLRLEAKVAYLERHVTAQDKVMLEMGDDLVRLRAELRMLRERGTRSTAENEVGLDEAGDERPPHY